VGKLIAEILKRASKYFLRKGKPPQSPRNARRTADERGSTSRQKDDCVGDCKPANGERKNDPIKNKGKLERQMEQRGWTREQVEEAMKTGERFPAKNMQTGGSATRYVHPKTGQSVVVDDTTGGIIHVGGPGFVY